MIIIRIWSFKKCRIIEGHSRRVNAKELCERLGYHVFESIWHSTNVTQLTTSGGQKLHQQGRNVHLATGVIAIPSHPTNLSTDSSNLVTTPMISFSTSRNQA